MSAYYQDPPPQQGGSGVLKFFLFGCLGVTLLMVLACGIGGVVLYYEGPKLAGKLKSVAADAARQAMIEEIDKSEIPEDQKKEMVAQIDRVADGFKSGEISVEDLGNIMQSLAESPAIVLLAVYAIDQKYIRPSGLSDEEKENAQLTIQRIARGVFQEQILPEDLEPALEPISQPGPDGERQLKESVTDEELRAALARCRQIADDAGIPDEPFQVDLGAEFKKAVDAALKQ